MAPLSSVLVTLLLPTIHWPPRRRPKAQLLLDTLRRPHERILRGRQAALRAGQAAGANVVVVLADPAVRVLDFETLKGVGEDAVARGEKRVLQGLRGGEALLRVVLEEACEELVPLRAEGGER